MKSIIYIVVFLFISFISCNTASYLDKEKVLKEETKDSIAKKSTVLIANTDLEVAVHQIIELYNQKQQKELNSYIHPDIGIYFLFRRGTVDEWKKENQICLFMILPIFRTA